MTISKKDVEHVAKLARLGLSEEEKEKLTQQLNDILKYAEQINQLDTDKVPPTSHSIPMQNVFREDEAKPCRNTADILANGPQTQETTFRVPKMLE
ncbi:MAG: Asp-tRNA(Asn)/Glu-tRNA(Gln) amidotransferase subunit GatC [Candidatus Margulisbacteria bacterium]|nr:Asp-tRNA(Asn)/Glu-tRNA(Gln) amidotransferase subunit GatC [Candidatus Margulisiibacteriota bacterium]MBU1022307.1 Asp-tRNA(Asn)/Glu-tRNA(Gln) amidotransferase subunit GatC [Candidatus Margulisiibacteriota bacterium]MBU1729920.1 Asp-tRNA(Asn)/Glu-tRNA(Gln) amidotransferase subunit GatC [Candidatus Margulisiibacteriota bacterium]MBU1955953.1 Asp-tRNA(Asn)/Glu-tRNA(Gln) amidotransferase subunit GatC [Candidatus Margulisiibacteriota bacterium]